MTTSTRTLGSESKMNLRYLFLSCLGLIHLIAFWSYYVQFPGLLSSSGLEPVHRLLRYAAPTLHRQGWTDDDTLCELAAILGMFLATLEASGLCQHGLVFGLSTSLYSLLVRTGGTFYSFQWDTLLLEASTITALTYAPWLRSRPDEAQPKWSISPWPLRFLLFKLMYMSGVVKIQSRCPTWLNLTALEYHFSTQCLPGPLAWHFHQMHPFLLRCGVAMTLWLEIPATILLLIPSTTVRRIGASMQICLQIMIILTGNYNFFNLLTIALCIPVIDSDVSTSNNTVTNRIRSLWRIGCYVYCLWTMSSMFRISTVDNALSIRLMMTPLEVDHYTDTILPLVLYSLILGMTYLTIHDCVSHRSWVILIHGISCTVVVGMIALPLFSLTHNLQRSGFVGSKTLFAPLYHQYAQPYHLSNGYGLFRRMTGVGAFPSGATGWAGLPLSVVARPEIIFEVQVEDGTWHELSFRWKPGSVSSMPRQAAPYQPRLDWQMWFAALGQLSQNPWLIHLTKKVLDGCEPVMDLLGDPLLANSKVEQIQAKLYHYDFTRIKSDWSIRLPGVQVLPSDGTYWTSIRVPQPDPVWYRTLHRDYMSTIEAGNPSIARYIDAHGYKSVCENNENRCKQNGNSFCTIAKTIRSNQLHLFFPLSFLCIIIYRVFRAVFHGRMNAAKAFHAHEKDE